MLRSGLPECFELRLALDRVAEIGKAFSKDLGSPVKVGRGVAQCLSNLPFKLCVLWVIDGYRKLSIRGDEGAQQFPVREPTDRLWMPAQANSRI